MKVSGLSLVAARLPKETPEIDDAEPNITEVDDAGADVAVAVVEGAAAGDKGLLLAPKLKPAKGLGLDVFASSCGLDVVSGFCLAAALFSSAVTTGLLEDVNPPNTLALPVESAVPV